MLTRTVDSVSPEILLLLQVLKLLRGREAGRPEAPEQPPLPLIQELSLEGVRARKTGMRRHQPLEIVSPHPWGRGRGAEPWGQVKWARRGPVTRQGRRWNIEIH